MRLQDEEVVEEDVRREEVDVEDATATRGRRGAGKTARTANPEGRAEEDRPGREETGRDEDFFEKARGICRVNKAPVELPTSVFKEGRARVVPALFDVVCW